MLRTLIVIVMVISLNSNSFAEFFNIWLKRCAFGNYIKKLLYLIDIIYVHSCHQWNITLKDLQDHFQQFSPVIFRILKKKRIIPGFEVFIIFFDWFYYTPNLFCQCVVRSDDFIKTIHREFFIFRNINILT